MFTFLPLKEADFELVMCWQGQPHVNQWWDGPNDLEGIREYHAPRLSPDHPVRMFIVGRNGRPFGRIQYESTARWLPGFGPEVANVDFLIGQRADIGQGLGPMMIDQFVREIVFANGRFTKVISDPEASNARSVRALEKAGFHFLKEHKAEGKLFKILLRESV